MKKMEEMMKNMGKKSGKMSDADISAKHDVLKELMNMAHGVLAGKTKDGMSGMRATVMAKDPASLAAGLDAAKDAVKIAPHDGEPDNYESADDSDETFGDLGSHDSNSLGEEAEKDMALPLHLDGEKADDEDQKPHVEADEEEYDGLFAKKHAEDKKKKMKK